MLLSLPKLSARLLECSLPKCDSHLSEIDKCCEDLLTCLSSSAQSCFPLRQSRSKVVTGWNEFVHEPMRVASFWNRIWVDAGCPSAGVLAQIRKRTKAQYKYAIRRVKRRRDHIVRKKIGSAIDSRNNCEFWREVKKVKSSTSGPRRPIPVIDGLIDVADICSNFRNKPSSILNSSTTTTDSLLSEIGSCVSLDAVSDIYIYLFLR